MIAARLACLLTATLLLASCGDDGDVSDDGREASGEVLEGSISDEMLPLEQVRSQAPLAEPAAGEEGGAGASTSAPGAGETDYPAAEEAEEATPPSETEPAPED